MLIFGLVWFLLVRWPAQMMAHKLLSEFIKSTLLSIGFSVFLLFVFCVLCFGFVLFCVLCGALHFDSTWTM